MNDKEYLSALLDDELAPTEIELSISKLSGNEETDRLADRYHLIGSSLRGEANHLSSGYLLAGIREKLADEPIVLAPKSEARRESKGKSSSLFKMAIAASLAVVAVGFYSQIGNQVGPIVNPPDRLTDNKIEKPSLKPQWNTMTPELQAKLDHYLVSHHELSVPAVTGGLMPYSTLVSFDSESR